VCVVCVCKGGGETEGLVPIIFQLGLDIGILWGRVLLIVPEPASSVIPTLARTRGPGALNPILVTCHRFKKTQVEPLCLPEILTSQQKFSWPACTDKRSQAARARSWTQTSVLRGTWGPHRPSALQWMTSATPQRHRGRHLKHSSYKQNKLLSLNSTPLFQKSASAVMMFWCLLARLSQ